MALKSRKREYKPDLTVKEAMLTVPNKPDPKKRRSRHHGRFTRKNLTEFLFDLFEANEMLPAAQRRTNAALVDIICQEFPKNYSLHVRLRKGEKLGVNYYRQRYNSGRLVTGRPVKIVSYRYNERGDRVDYSTGKKRLTHLQVKEIHQKYCNAIIKNYKKYYAKASAETDPTLPQQ